VDTRLRKIGEQHVADGTILAAAGMKRLGIETWPGVDFAPLGFDQMVPAVGQGAIAVQCREADAAKFAAIFDAATMRAVTLERAFQNALGGGCHTAFAAHVSGDMLHLFHENLGLASQPLSADDFVEPALTAERLLREFKLLP
jgi:hydroxymethylbilane synthase